MAADVACTSDSEPSEPPIEVETTQASLLHRLARFNGSWLRAALIYFITAASAYGLLFITAKLSRVLTASSSASPKLSFLSDWNIAFTFLVTVPVIVLFIVSDQYVLQSALKRVQKSGGLVIDPGTAQTLMTEWTHRFRTANVFAQIIILAVSAALSALTLRLYFVTNAGFWAAPPGPLRVVGIAYWYCITLLYFGIAYYCFRCIKQALLLRDLVKRASVSVRPFHPDGCGGLQPIGSLGLRNQYTLTVLGINIVIVAAVNYTSLATLAAERQILIVVVIAVLIYAIVGPIVFMAPLLPFRDKMRETKLSLLAEVGDRLTTEFHRIRGTLQTEAISETDIDILERLRKLIDMVKEEPVWPFDARTLRRFGSAYLLPILISLATKAATTFLI